jgi:murein DD-endopeptidase MepM/ murein hydrolase activator NlpD
MAVRPSAGRITSGYGWRTHPVTGLKSFHTGEDIGRDQGRRIISPITGTVAGYGSAGSYGNRLILRNGATEIWICHLAASLIRVGSRVQAGQHIATMGSTGRATGVHAHWEVHINGRRLDPAAWLRSTNQLKPLRRGSRGYAVRELQARLGITDDGMFGPITEQAVIAYQRRHGLTVDGIAGANTLGHLGL